jgi:hypothetical protein
VYWITGGACAGKTTVTALLASKHGVRVFPDRHTEYQQEADFSEFPALRFPWPGTDWEWFFGRSVEESARWLDESTSADLEFKIADLLAEPRDRDIVVDVIADPQVLVRIAGVNRVVCLFGGEGMIRRELLHREDHKMILDCIRENTSDPARMEESVVSAAIEMSRRQRDSAVAAGARIIQRLPDTNPADLLTEVAEHFGFK